MNMPAASSPAWASSYHPNINSDMPPLRATNLVELLRESALRHGDRPAFSLCLPGGIAGTLSFAEIDALSDRFARYLQHVLRVPQGARVALQMPNCLAYPVCAFGAIKGGFTLVNLNPLATEPETEHYLRDSGAEVYVGLDLIQAKVSLAVARAGVRHRFTTAVYDFLPRSRRVVAGLLLRLAGKQAPPRDGALDLIAAVQAGEGQPEILPHQPDPEDVALLQYTGGTTGISKGVMLSHRNIVANVSQLGTYTVVDATAGACGLTPVPIYHILAMANALLLYAEGGNNILIPNPRPISNLKAAFRRWHITWMVGVTPLYEALLREPWFIKNPPRQLRVAAAGGTSVPADLSSRWKERVGRYLCEGYGLTEASPCVSTNLVAESGRQGTVGLPLPGTEIRIVDDALNDVPDGEAGEILVKGPQVMEGYWQRPDETAEVLLEDGWLRTGDVGKLDEAGFLVITDRKKDLIIVSAFNVYPREVEDALLEHPAVMEAAVVGVPDPKTGERPWAFVVLEASAQDVTADAIIDHCRSRLTAYKVPVRVEIRTDLPKTNVGKVSKQVVREEARRLAAEANPEAA